jgi:hypothetical protein
MDRCAFDRGSTCSALICKDCTKCGFYKTEAKLIAGRTKATRRVAAMPEGFREYVYDKYYGYYRKKG